jgi:peptidyl-tRNA hydrolase
MNQPYNYLRGLTIPSFDTEESGSPLALIYVVNATKEHPVYEADIFTASILATMELLANDSIEVRGAVEAWLGGRIRKLVKRARGRAWDDTATTGHPYAEATVGTATVRVFTPMAPETQPKAIKSLQVSGLNGEKDEELETAIQKNLLLICVDSALGMSTGKTVAQINHVAQLFLMNGEPEKVEAWISTGFPVRIIMIPLEENDKVADVLVRDAGFTEIPAGSLTALGIFIP